jgi:hypothetical protein
VSPAPKENAPLAPAHLQEPAIVGALLAGETVSTAVFMLS